MYNRGADLLSGFSGTEVLTGDVLCTQNHFLEFLKENYYKPITASNTCWISSDISMFDLYSQT